MKVFVTGAAGFIGQATIKELLLHGHTVLGLARSDATAEKISGLGASVHRGDLTDLASLAAGAAASEGVIHLAFGHDFSDLANSIRRDREAIEAMAKALGPNKPLVIASGLLMLPAGVLAHEEMRAEPSPGFGERARAEHLVQTLSEGEDGVRGSVVRLAPSVHGPGDKGFVKIFGDAAKRNGFVTYVGDGASRWPAVHRDDSAVLFRLALEKGRAGAIYHGVAEQAIPTKRIMEAIAGKIGFKAESKTAEEATGALGMLGHVLVSDHPCSSDLTQKELGWTPKEIGLIEDIENNYF